MPKICSLHLSAPGKIILCGEHAVVYGKKALACSIDLRTILKLSKNQQNSLQIQLTEQNFVLNQQKFDDLLTKPSESLILSAIRLLSLNFDMKWSDLQGYTIEIDTQLPISAGLGSSASLAVCLSTCFLLQSSKISEITTNESLKLINSNAFEVEKIFHGKPSGIDNTVVTYGGYILYQNGQIKDKFKATLDLNVIIINTGLPKATIEQVCKVRELNDRYPQLINCIMSSIDLLVDKFIDSLQNKQENDIEELIKINQSLLESLQISNEKFSEIVRLCARHGFACKITGAGGGGCCFATLLSSKKDHTQLQDLFNSLNVAKISFFQTNLASDGIRLESIEFYQT